MKKAYNNRKIGTYLFMTFVLMILVQSGCKKLIETDLPIDKNTAETVFSNTGTAAAALNGIYIHLVPSSFVAGAGGISVNAGLLADELVDNITGLNGLYRNEAVEPRSFWVGMYSEYMYRINSLIKGVSASKGIPEGHKRILLGEAKVLRSLIYFNLVNLYGDVPLVLTTDFKTNSDIPRSSTALVYQQMIKDLTEAQQGLPDQYLGGDLGLAQDERVRPNKAAATALLARIYLYLGQWPQAETEASKIINNTAVYGLPVLNAVFLANSREAIWQLQTITYPNNPLTIAGDANYFIPPTGVKPEFTISPYVLNAFESTDARRNAWVRNVTSGGTSYAIPNKYKAGKDRFATNPEYNMVFRLAEQYLIRAEARAQQGKLTGANSAESDLNAIRARAGLTGTTASTQIAMLDAILKERQVELFTEWGHRWYDLKRTGKIDAVMSVVAPVKGATWASYKALLPIPGKEFELNPALRGHQNPGYIEPTF